jgi:hypothetical protein
MFQRALRSISPENAMRTYLIAYDLAQQRERKHAIAETIMHLGRVWARPLEQVWFVRSEASEGELEARLAWLLGADDGLLIQAVEEDALLTNTQLRWFRQRDGADPREAALLRFAAGPPEIAAGEARMAAAG